MEHLSWRATRSMDVLLLVSDPTKVGVETAARLLTLTKEMKLDVGMSVLVINGMRSVPHPAVQEVLERLQAGRVVHIPFSEEVLNFSVEVMSFWALIQKDRDHAA